MILSRADVGLFFFTVPLAQFKWITDQNSLIIPIPCCHFANYMTSLWARKWHVTCIFHNCFLTLLNLVFYETFIKTTEGKNLLQTGNIKCHEGSI